MDLPTIQRINGHKTLAMVLRYVNVHGEHINAAISVLDNIGGAITHTGFSAIAAAPRKRAIFSKKVCGLGIGGATSLWSTGLRAAIPCSTAI